MERITTEEVMDELDMFQSRFGKIDEFGWWNWERILADADKQFTSAEFQDEYQTRGVHLRLSALEHQKMNGQVKVTWRTLHTVEHSLMAHLRVLEGYIRFELIYTADHILLVLPIKDSINKEAKPNTQLKLQQVLNLKYHIYVYYFFLVFYVKLLNILGQIS